MGKGQPASWAITNHKLLLGAGWSLPAACEDEQSSDACWDLRDWHHIPADSDLRMAPSPTHL